jgi:hypothetical protein
MIPFQNTLNGHIKVFPEDLHEHFNLYIVFTVVIARELKLLLYLNEVGTCEIGLLQDQLFDGSQFMFATTLISLIQPPSRMNISLIFLTYKSPYRVRIWLTMKAISRSVL